MWIHGGGTFHANIIQPGEADLWGDIFRRHRPAWPAKQQSVPRSHNYANVGHISRFANRCTALWTGCLEMSSSTQDSTYRPTDSDATKLGVQQSVQVGLMLRVLPMSTMPCQQLPSNGTAQYSGKSVPKRVRCTAPTNLGTPMLASVHCKHLCICLSWHYDLSRLVWHVCTLKLGILTL